MVADLIARLPQALGERREVGRRDDYPHRELEAPAPGDADETTARAVQRLPQVLIAVEDRRVGPCDVACGHWEGAVAPDQQANPDT
jgi:hypothetical protein